MTAIFVAATILTTAAPPAATAPPAPQTFREPGVHYFEGRTVCPFAGLGARADHASNRLALDDNRSTVTIDSQRGRITILNEASYPEKATIADLTFLGVATAEGGARTPLAVHLKVEKKKTKVSVDLHPHWTVRGKLTDPELEPFQIVVSDGTSEKVVAAGADLLRVATETKIAYTVAGALVEIKDNLAGRGPSLAANGALVDLSLGFGTKHVNKMLIRAALRSLEAGNATLAGKPVAALLTAGAWQLRLTAESSLLSQETLRRDLFMLGLDRIPVVAAGMKKGLAKGETVAFTFRAGQGRVSWGSAEAELPAPLDVARAFMEFNFLGAVLARQAGLAAAALGTAPPTPRKQ
jgi:hypothetical protein